MKTKPSYYTVSKRILTSVFLPFVVVIDFVMHFMLLDTKQARRQGWLKSIFNEFLDIAISVPLLTIVITCLFEFAMIPTGSMNITLREGDCILVAKYSYGFSKHSLPLLGGRRKGYRHNYIEKGPLVGSFLMVFDHFIGFLSDMVPSGKIWTKDPIRGDVVVLRGTKYKPDTRFIKRVVGLPGDRIQFKDGVMYVNDVPCEQKYLGQAFTYRWRGVKREPGKLFEEALPDGRRHLLFRATNLEKKSEDSNNTEVYVVPSDHFLCRGDNINNSDDGRNLSHIGFVHRDCIIGKALFVFFSLKEKASFSSPWFFFTNIRYNDMLRKIDDYNRYKNVEKVKNV